MRLMMKQGCIISLMHFYFHSKSSKKVFSHNSREWVSEYVMWYNNANNFIFSYRFQALTNYSVILIFFCTLNHIYLLIWLEANNLLWTYKKKLNMCDLNFLIIFILFLNWSIFLNHHDDEHFLNKLYWMLLFNGAQLNRRLRCKKPHSN